MTQIIINITNWLISISPKYAWLNIIGAFILLIVGILLLLFGPPNKSISWLLLILGLTSLIGHIIKSNFF